MAQNLPHLPDWEQLSTNIIRILGGNPSKFTLQGTNTYLLGSGSNRILIDTGSGEKKWIDTLRTVLNSPSSFNSPSHEPLTISTCLLTHWHHDHLGGVRDLEELHRDLHSNGNEVEVYKNQPSWNPDGLIDPSRVHDISDGQKFSVPTTFTSTDFEVQAIQTPGHAKDHMVFQITGSSDPTEIGAVFTADNVLGHGTAVFEDLALYLDSLDVMKKRVVDAIATQDSDKDRQTGVGGGPNSSAHSTQQHAGSETISGGPNSSAHTNNSTTSPASSTKRAYPGHGAVVEDSVAKIDEYIAHRRMREEEALNVLRYGTVKALGDQSTSATTAAHDSITRTGDQDNESLPTGGREIVSGKEWDSMEMVRVIYRHYPENLWEPAERGLLMVLEKLKKDGKVVNVAGGGARDEGGSRKGKWMVSEKATL